MASIFIYNRARGKCVELNSTQIVPEDLQRLRKVLPKKVEGLSFSSLPQDLDSTSLPHLRVEASESRVAEYLKGIGLKLEQLEQISGAIGFYDLSFRLSPKGDVLLMRAKALSQIGQVGKAEYILHRYLAIHPGSAEAYYLLGKISLNRNDYNGAKTHFSSALKLAHQDEDQKKWIGVLEIYERFVGIYLERDTLFTRNLPQATCVAEVRRLIEQSQQLLADIHQHPSPEIAGMIFFIENQEKTFEKWLELMEAGKSLA